MGSCFGIPKFYIGFYNYPATWVKIFLLTGISRNTSIYLFWPKLKIGGENMKRNSKTQNRHCTEDELEILALVLTDEENLNHR